MAQLLHKSPSFGRGPNAKLIHSKSILILHTTPLDGPAEGFLYLGSHNMFAHSSYKRISLLIPAKDDRSLGNSRTSIDIIRQRSDSNEA